LLLAIYCKGNNPWHCAAIRVAPDVLLKILDLANNILTTQEMKDNLLLATDKYGYTTGTAQQRMAM
jgi:hypothetical protein